MRKFYVVVALVLFCAIAEAKKFPLTASSAVPAARGQVLTDKDKNGNTRVSVEVEHLANPQNLTPPASVYVVWFQDKGGNPENKGQMKVDKNLNGSFRTSTAARSFDLFITGERDYSANTPLGAEVFRTSIQE